eukprot:scaffold5043_cov115-Isochrysis_galbana.AAC.7
MCGDRLVEAVVVQIWWPISLGVEERVNCSGFTEASGVGLIPEGPAGGGSGAQLVGSISSLGLRRGPAWRAGREIVCSPVFQRAWCPIARA